MFRNGHDQRDRRANRCDEAADRDGASILNRSKNSGSKASVFAKSAESCDWARERSDGPTGRRRSHSGAKTPRLGSAQMKAIPYKLRKYIIAEISVPSVSSKPWPCVARRVRT